MPERALSICARVCWSSWPPGVAAEPPAAPASTLAGTEAPGEGAVDAGADPGWTAGADWAAPDGTPPDWARWRRTGRPRLSRPRGRAAAPTARGEDDGGNGDSKADRRPAVGGHHAATEVEVDEGLTLLDPWG